MNWLASAFSELFSLFVDDVRFTVALVLWIAFSVIALPRLLPASEWDAPLLFMGCAAILVIGSWIAARK